MKTNTTAYHTVFLAALIVAFSNEAAITWTNVSGGNWSGATNWSPNEVPGPADDALITANGTYTVTLDTSPTLNTLTLGGASGQQTLNTSGNNLNVNNPSAVNGNGILGLSGGLAGVVTVYGTMNWSGGGLGNGASLTIGSNGVLNILSNVVVQGAVTNQGTVNWQAGNVEVDGVGGGYSGAIWNQAGGVWNIQCDQTMSGPWAAPFSNAGLVHKSGATGTTSFNMYLANSGTVHAQSGTMQFIGGSDLGGTLQADAGAAIYFAGGNMTLSHPPNFQGPGPVQLTGGSLTLSNFVGTFALDGVVLAGESTLSSGTLNWNSGALGNGASLTIGSNGVLNILSNVVVQGAVTNQGTVNWEAGNVEVDGVGGGYSGAIWNQAGAVWNIQCDQTMSGPWAAPFNNAGLVHKSGATGTTSFNMYLANSGGVHAQSGTMQFIGGSDLGGIFQADASAAIYFAGGNMTLSHPPNFQGPGPVQLTGGSLTLSNFVGTFALDGVSLSGESTLSSGTLNWNSGGLANGASLTIGSNGVLNILSNVVVQGAMTNQGTVNWEAGNVEVDSVLGGYSGAIWNQAGAVWNIQCDQTMSGPWAAPFNNAGLVHKSGATGTTSFNVYLANSGTVHAQSGTMQFIGGSDLGGTLQADASAAIYFAGGNMTLSHPPNFQGPGPVQLTGGSLTLTNFVGTFALDGVVLAGESTLSSGTLNWNSGALGNGASLTIGSNGVLNILSNVVVQGAMTNQGTVNWEAGNVEVDSVLGGYSGAIWNQAGAVWNIQCDQTMSGPWAAPFNNAGLVHKSGATGTTSFNVYLANSGTVHAQSGTVQFGGGSDLGGTFQADASAAIYFAGGNITLSAPPNFQGPGPVQLTGGSLTLSNFVGAFALDGVSLSGESTLSSGTLNWNSGGLANGASLTIGSNGVLNILSNVVVQGAMTNQGTVNWQAGNVEVDGAGGGYSGAIWNQPGAVWNIHCDQTISGPWVAPFNNAGLVHKSGATGTTGFNVYLANSGMVETDTGTISFSSTYSSTSSATLAFDLGGSAPGTGYGQLQFGAPVVLAGTLSATTRNGYLPNPGDTFQILTYSSASGSFGCLNLDLGNGILLVPEQGATSLALMATAYATNATQPTLQISRLSPGLLVQWQLGFPNWVLQSSTNLTVWSPMAATCANQAQVRITGPQQYFRLKRSN